MPLDVAQRGTLDVKDPPLAAIVAANDNYEAGYHNGNPGGLDAIDTDLAVANIKNGVVIFGFTGTFIGGVMTHDDMDSDVDNQGDSASYIIYFEWATIPADGDVTIATITLTCLQATVIEAAYFISARANDANRVKLQMFIDGVGQGETAFLLGDNKFHLFYDIANKAVASGARVIYLNAHAYSGGSSVPWTGGIFAGCCKLV